MDATLNVTFLEKSAILKHFCGTAGFSDGNREFESLFLIKITIGWNEENISLELGVLSYGPWSTGLRRGYDVIRCPCLGCGESPGRKDTGSKEFKKEVLAIVLGRTFSFICSLFHSTKCMPDSLNILIPLICIKPL